MDFTRCGWRVHDLFQKRHQVSVQFHSDVVSQQHCVPSLQLTCLWGRQLPSSWVAGAARAAVRWPAWTCCTRRTSETKWSSCSDQRYEGVCFELLPFHSQVQKVHSPDLFEERCISEVVRIGSVIVYHLSRFFMLCDVIFLVTLQGKFETDHSWEKVTV